MILIQTYSWVLAGRSRIAMTNPTVTTNPVVISNIPIILCLNSPIDIPGYPCSVLSLAISL